MTQLRLLHQALPVRLHCRLVTPAEYATGSVAATREPEKRDAEKRDAEKREAETREAEKRGAEKQDAAKRGAE